jgi:3-oxoacyl-[acyl-carrier protein] reductase
VVGRAIVGRLVASGARVTLWDRDRALAERTASEIGPAAGFVQVDMTDWDAWRDAQAPWSGPLGRM